MGMKKFKGTAVLSNGKRVPVSAEAGSMDKALSIVEKKLKSRGAVYTSIDIKVVNEADTLPEGK